MNYLESPSEFINDAQVGAPGQEELAQVVTVAEDPPSDDLFAASDPTEVVENMSVDELIDLKSLLQVHENTPEGSGEAPEDGSVDATAERLATLDLQSVCSQVTADQPAALSTQQLPNGTKIQVHGFAKRPEVTQQ